MSDLLWCCSLGVFPFPGVWVERLCLHWEGNLLFADGEGCAWFVLAQCKEEWGGRVPSTCSCEQWLGKHNFPTECQVCLFLDT